MNQEPSAASRIRAFIVQTFPAVRKRAITDDMALLELGIVESLGMLDVVTFPEQTFLIAISDDELTPDNFRQHRASDCIR